MAPQIVENLDEGLTSNGDGWARFARPCIILRRFLYS